MDDHREAFLLTQLINSLTAVLRDGTEEDALALLSGIAHASEVRDPAARGHPERVTAYALALADTLGVDAAVRAGVALAGPYHDIGKVAIPGRLLRKTGALTPEEFDRIKGHAAHGATILSHIPLYAGATDAVAAVRHHHERWDGKGYPDGLAGEAIPLSARIIALADSYDTMTTNRSYRIGMAREWALNLMAKDQGQWDPALLARFLDLMRIQPDPQAGRSVADLITVIERIPSAVLVTNSDGQPSLINEPMIRLLGGSILDADAAERHTPGAFQSRDAATGEPVPTDQTPFALALRGISTERRDIRYRRAGNAGEAVGRFSGTPLFAEDGSVAGAILVAEDVTALYKAQHELRATDRFRRAVTLSFDILATMDDTGRFLEVNPAFERVLGHSYSLFREHSFLEYVHPDDLDKTTAALEWLNHGTPLKNFRNRLRDALGHYHWMEWIATRLAQEGRIYAAARDITWELEYQLKMHQSEELYRLVVQTAQEGIWLIGEDGITQVANAALAALLGYAPEDLIGKPAHQFLDPASGAALTEALAGRRREDRARSREYRFVRPDGSEVYAVVNSAPIVTEDDRSLGTLLMVLDKTTQHRHEEVLTHRATHDALTGLPNRTLFHDRLRTMISGDRRLRQSAVCVLDLNGFKEINDTMGHPAGDHVLQQVAQRIVQALRRGDTVARLGGDEFGLLLPGTDDAGARSMFAHLGAALAAPIPLNGGSVRIEGAIGVALFREHGSDPDHLLARADAAMYHAKRNGLGVAVWSAEMEGELVTMVDMDLPAPPEEVGEEVGGRSPVEEG